MVILSIIYTIIKNWIGISFNIILDCEAKVGRIKNTIFIMQLKYELMISLKKEGISNEILELFSKIILIGSSKLFLELVFRTSSILEFSLITSFGSKECFEKKIPNMNHYPQQCDHNNPSILHLEFGKPLYLNLLNPMKHLGPCALHHHLCYLPVIEVLLFLYLPN